MREIKFRAWHKGYPGKGAFKGIEPLMIYDDAIGDVLQWKKQGQPLDIMQFTGIRDKSGVNIYEGDIVSGGSKSNTGVVVYSELQAGFYCVTKTESISLHGFCGDVIGNIYETPYFLDTP